MHTPTEEQQAIIEASRSTIENLLVNALAGAAKTTTLEMVCHAVTGIPILSLAFNKRIADEMGKKLPPHVECRTMNSLGHRVWGAVVGRRLVVNTNKSAEVVKQLIAAMPRTAQQEAWAMYGDILRWMRAAKRDGYVPSKWRGHAKFSMPEADWAFKYPEEEDLSEEGWKLLDSAMAESIEQAYKGQIDYDDQIYMPVCFGATWPRFPLVLIDEFQDLNELQHEMLAALVGDRRLIGVGDPWQSIYAFRGAKQNGMASARERWSMQEFNLSISFRVPQAGVERARSRVPHMRARPGAPVGRIETLRSWNEATIEDGAAVICRNNAPLFSAALRLLSRGRPIKLIGMDIGPGLVRLMKKFGPASMTKPQVYDAIQAWAEAERRKEKPEGVIEDRMECLFVLCSAPTLGESITQAEILFKREGHIQLLSAHKAKGLEWETVYILDPWRMPSKWAKPGTEAFEQELNTRYVAETRFKETMFLMNLEDFE